MMSMGRTESLPHRSRLRPDRPATFVFIRDPASERRDGLALAGLLILASWPKRAGVTREPGHRETVAAVVRRLLAGRAGIGKACWVDAETITPAEFQFDWLRRQMADHSTVAVRLADAEDAAGDGFGSSRLRVACGRIEPGRAA